MGKEGETSDDKEKYKKQGGGAKWEHRGTEGKNGKTGGTTENKSSLLSGPDLSPGPPKCSNRSVALPSQF